MGLSDVEILDETHNNRAHVVDDDSITSDSTEPWPIDDGRKRKMVVSSGVPAKKQYKERIFVSVDDLSSSITEDDVKRLFEFANISSSDYKYLVPSKDQRANRPPQGYIAVYEEQIQAGLRFPLHDLLVEICNHIRVSPSQLMPTAHRAVVGFILCAKFYNIPVTVSPFFSLFNVFHAIIEGSFGFSSIKEKRFLRDEPLSDGSWMYKFFFLRKKGTSWNCITQWSKTFKSPASDAYLAPALIEKGILKHHFRVNELTSKELLVCGGIEPGVPSPEYTFRFLMHKAAVTKFDLSPEDMPLARATTGEIHTIPLKITPFTGPIAAHINPSMLTDCTAFHAQPSDEHLVNHQPLISTPNHTEIPCKAETHIYAHLPAPTENNIPLNDPHCKGYMNHESESCKEHKETNSTVPVPDEAEHQSFPPGLLTLWQVIESAYVPKDHYQKLKKDADKLSSELAYTKSLMKELKQELQLSEARIVDSENKISAAHEALKTQSDFDKIRDNELANKKLRIQELEQELEIWERKGAEYEIKISLGNEARNDLEKRVKDMHLDLERTQHSELAYKSRIQVLERGLKVSEAAKADFEKRTHLANEATKNLEKRIRVFHSESEQIRHSELAYKSRNQDLERKLEVSEATKAEFEKRTHMANEAAKNLKKMIEVIQSELVRLRDLELPCSQWQNKKLERDLKLSEAKRADFERRAYLANEANKDLAKMINNLKSGTVSQINRDTISREAVEAFKSSPEFLNIVHAATYSLDSNFFGMSVGECGQSSEPVDKMCSKPRNQV